MPVTALLRAFFLAIRILFELVPKISTLKVYFFNFSITFGTLKVKV